MAERRPTPAELQAARARRLTDVIGPGLRVLFCGINPGLYSAAIGRHFGRPGNRFWPALHAGGFTDRVFSPYEDESLLALGLGLTNLVARASAGAAELSDEELRRGRAILERKVLQYRPASVAFLGVSAYRTAFSRPQAPPGRQAETIGDTILWVLPSPSGLNAHYLLEDLGRLVRALRNAMM